MNSAKLYICLLILKHADTGGSLSSTKLAIASSKEAALQQCEAFIRKGAFASGTRDWIIERSSFTEVDRELLEQAATEILGWSPPSS
jgi:hypothetical protein